MTIVTRIREMATDTFWSQQNFSTPASQYDFVSVTSNTRGGLDLNCRQLQEQDLRNVLTDNDSENVVFKLLQIDHHHYSPLGINKQLFQLTFQYFGLDRGILDLVHLHAYGFYTFDRLDTATKSFYIGDTHYMIIWSYNQKGKTRAIVFNRGTHRPGVVDELWPILEKYKDFASKPCYLPMAICIREISFAENRRKDVLDILRRAEAITGHGTWSFQTMSFPDRQRGMDAITLISQEVGGSAIRVASSQRRLNVLKSLLDYFLEPDMARDSIEVNAAEHSQAIQTPEALKKVGSDLKSRLQWTQADYAYQLKRTSILSAVVRKDIEYFSPKLTLTRKPVI